MCVCMCIYANVCLYVSVIENLKEWICTNDNENQNK